MFRPFFGGFFPDSHEKTPFSLPYQKKDAAQDLDAIPKMVKMNGSSELGNCVMAARMALNHLVGVRIPFPQL